LLTFFRDQERVRQWLHEFGPLAPLSSVALNAAQVVVAPVPGQVIGLANGYLFGVLWGTFYSVIGLTLGSALAMGLGRWLGRPIVERFVPPEELARWDHLAQRRGPIFFLLVFLLPLVPDDVACFAVGFSPLSIPYILAIAIVGRLPGLIFTSWLGANASALSPVGLTLIIFGAVILAGFVLRYRSQIEARLVRLAERWSERF
jgi:uncharacterized membrane protein YdjX (TVP38/TMEM64 family)